jgi:DNA segregation ATPase FtsK/SpoIIIE, S-DNA-T family
MAAAKKGVARGKFLPQGAAEALRRLGVRLGGVALLVLALLAALALLTADPRDPSLNTAVDGPVNNALGAFGASLADLLSQLFGLAALAIVLVAAIWGLLVALRAGPPSLWSGRLAALPVGVVAAAIALASLPQPNSNLLPAGSGGAFGRVLHGALIGILPPDLAWVVGLVAALLGFGLLIFSLGLSPADWAGLGKMGKRSVQVAVATGGHATQALRRPALEPQAPRREPQSVAPRWSAQDDDDDEEDELAPPFAIQSPPEDDDDDVPGILPQPGALVEPKRPPPPAGKRERAARQGMLDLGVPAGPGYELPPLGLLALPPENAGPKINQDSLAQNAKMLENVLEDFGVNGKVVKVRPGPVVTLYELEPAPGTKTSRVIGLADDIARSMSALSVRIATIPGRSVIGIELPNSWLPSSSRRPRPSN